jgi:hypothetical protein
MREQKTAPPARVDFMREQRAVPPARPTLAPKPEPKAAPAPSRKEPAPLSLTSLVTEPALSMLTGVASLLPSYARGLYGLATGESDPEAAKAIRETQRKMTYEPRTQMGKLGMETIRPAAEVLSVPSELIGKGVKKVTGSEVAGTIAQDVLGPEVVIPGAVGARTLMRRARGTQEVPPAVTPEPPAPPAPPTTVPEVVGKPKRGRKPKAKDLSIVKSPDQVNTQVVKSEVELSADPELEAARIAARDLPENVIPGVKTGERVAPTVAAQRNITNAAKELLETGEVKIDPSIPPFLQVANLLQSGRLRPDVYVDILKKNNLTPEEFSQSYVQEVSQAGRTLQILSDFRKFTREAEDAVEGINTQAAGGIIDDRGIFRRIEDIRRGLMVSQLSTAVRNATTGVGRSILDTGTRLIDFGIQKATGRVNPEMPLVTAGDAFGQVMNLLNPKQAMDLTKRILEVRPKEYDEMFRQYNAGVALGGKSSDILGAAEKGVYALNIFNRFQDSVMRSAVFADSVERGMKARGLDFHEVMKSGRMGDIPEDIVQRGVADAMEFTFSNAPKTKTEQAVVTAIDNIPPLAVAIPFPRFLINSMRFMTEYSPLGPLHLLSKNERAALKGGDTKLLSKSLAGSGLLYGAYALRDSEYAGEKWYELKGEDGKTIDMRPYAPFSAYLFVGDVIKRNLNGTLYDLKGTDITEALAGIGSDKTGLQLVDGLLGKMREDPELGSKKAEDYLAKLGGEYAGTFFIPFQQLRDVMAELEPEEAKVRRVTEEPLTGPIEAKLPVASRALPESFSYTNPQPRVREAPALRQITGVTQISPKNAAEKEMDRLQIKEFQIFKRTGNPEADRLIASVTSKVTDDLISNLVQSENYKSLTNDKKRLYLKEFLSKANTVARKLAIKEMPEAFIEDRIKKSLSKDELRVLEEMGFKLPEGKNQDEPSEAPAAKGDEQSYDIDSIIAERDAGNLAPLIKSIYEQESSSGKVNTSKENYAGAKGPMQVTRKTFNDMRKSGLIPENYSFDNPSHLAEAGVALIQDLARRYNNDPGKIAAAYYGGPDAVKDGEISRSRRDPVNPKAPTVGEYTDKVLSRLMPTAQAKGKAQGGLVEPGNIDVSKLPAVRNADGTYSTVRSMGVNINGKEVLIPTVVNGRVVSDKEAIDHYLKTGKHLGVFSTPKESSAYAEKLHQMEAQRIKKARGGYTLAEELLLRRYANR